MTRTITQIKVWKSTDKKETRIYINFDGEKTGLSGCYYLTGNRWQAKGTLENMTAEEKAAALAICNDRFNDGKWHTIWSNEMNPAPAAPVASQPVAKSEVEAIASLPKNRYADHCNACGEALAPGAGWVSILTDEEDIDFIGGGRRSVVYCCDTTGCKQRQAEIKAEREAERQAEAEREAAWNELTPDEQKTTRDAFWNEFFERTAYIGS